MSKSILKFQIKIWNLELFQIWIFIWNLKMIFKSHKLFTRLREFETESCLLNARAITELTESNLLLRLTLEGPASA